MALKPLAVIALSVLLQAQGPAVADGPPIVRFQQVDPALYRGAQPDAEGFRFLRELGVRTVVNLRSERDAIRLNERWLVKSLGMRYVSIPVKDGSFFTRSRTIPEDAFRRFLEAVDAGPGPVFVHCRRGADRTGAVVALYRIARHGWAGQRAYDEARTLGIRSWYTGLRRQILAFRQSPDPAPASARP